MSSFWRTSILGSAMTAALGACQPELPPITWEGEVIRFAANDPETVCGDTLEWMDARAVALRDIFGEGTYDTLDYYWVPDLWNEQPWCQEPASGCRDANRIYSEYVPHEHEIAHALRRDRLPAVFEEGFATVFGDLGWTHEPASRGRLVEILESSDPVDNADYSRAGHFVRFLLDRYGMDRLDRLAELANYDDDASKVRTSFAEAYGITLEAALVEYEDYPECDALAWMDTRIACAEAAFPLNPVQEGDVEFSKDIECSEPTVLGPMSGFMFTETTLEIVPQLQDFPIWIQLIGDLGDDVSAALVRCDGGCADSTALWLTPTAGHRQVELPPGRYVLRMFRPVDDPGELGISLGF